MAFQDVGRGNFVNLGKDLAVGESYTGYPLKFASSTVQGRQVKNIIMQNAESGETETLSASGNLKYMVDDGKIELGYLTRITRTPDKKVKSLNSTQFKVEQDSDDTVTVSADKSVSLSTSTTSDKIKREAEALSAQATAGKRG